MENTDNCFSKRFSCHRIISRDDFGAGFTHWLAQFSPNNQGFFHSSSTQGILVQECVPGLPRTDTDSQLGTWVYAVSSDKHRLDGFRDESE
jgi:hypothetical protein